MAKRKPAALDPPAEIHPGEANGTLTEEAPTSASAPLREPAATASEQPPDNGNGCDRKPVKVFSYMVARDTYVLASVWDRVVTLADGATFTAHDVSVRKRYRDQHSGEWKSLYSVRGSEIYAVLHALAQASAWILEARANANDCPF